MPRLKSGGVIPRLKSGGTGWARAMTLAAKTSRLMVFMLCRDLLSDEFLMILIFVNGAGLACSSTNLPVFILAS